ncbi:MAG: HlyC/CorC family transporter [Lachnospiraceae bacterium]|nr:HlyC/CorC family transporter [Lachnospiraceae bacterium]
MADADGNPDGFRLGTILKTVKKGLGSKRGVNAQEVEEDILTMVSEGQEKGTIEADEAEMISNIFALNDKEAGDIMTHRSQIAAIEADMTLKEALDYMLDGTNSRFPVYEENIDHIIGILYLKDAFRMNRIAANRKMALKDIPDLLRKALFVTEKKKIDTLFQEMQQKKIQMAIIIDEYGQTAGLVTMEDILEEIVGNILDEYDKEESHIQKKGQDEYVIDGMSELKELEERFDIDFEEEEFDTLNGFLISKMDKIPEENEEFSIMVGDYEFQILEVENRRIAKVLVVKKALL